MNTIRQLASQIRGPRGPEASQSDESPQTLIPAIIYDDLAAGQRAMQLVDSVAHEYPDELEFRSIFWRLDLLEIPEWRVQARPETNAAHLLILSVSGKSPLSGAVAGWLKSCLAEHRDRALAVVALLGPPDDPDGPDSVRLQFLQRAAREAGVDFFAAPANREPPQLETAETVHERAEAMTPTLDGILHHMPDVSLVPAAEA